jgi:tetratricopeptide (TPR) repeat protein
MRHGHARAERLRGREVELEALGATLDRAASGRLAIAIVEGEAGIGKTRLLAQALQDARGHGFRDAAGRAHELERTRPFGLLADALGCDRSAADPRRAAIAALLTTRAGERGAVTVSSDPGLQFQAVDALVDLVETLALERPLALGLDDLQWADPSSLLTLAALARRLADLPVALVGCLRPMPRAGELERALEAMEAAGGRRLPLDRLGEQAVAELVADTVAAEPGRKLLAEVAAAGGNPLFVTELLGALLAEGAVQTVEGRAEVAEPTLPPTLRLTILRRLSFLPDDTLQALRAAAILGSSFSLTDLSVTTGRPVLELSTVLAAAIRARLLEEEGDRLRFRHDLIHEAIYLDLPASARVGLHREAGRRLAESGAAALQVAEHLARGAGRGDAAAIAWLVRAAREAAGSSPAVAAELLERAIGLTGPADPGRDQLLAERAGALMAAGRLTEAEAAYRRLLDRDHDPSVDAPARLWLARTLSAQGRMGDALRELQLLQRFPTLEDQLRAAVQGSEGVARLELGDLDGAAAAADQARSTAAPPATTRSSAWPPPRRRWWRSCGPTWTAPCGSSRAGFGWPTGARSARATAIPSTSCADASCWSWTGSGRPGRHCRTAGGSASSSACTGRFPCTRSCWRWSGSWPASGTTPSPGSRRRWSWRPRPVSATASCWSRAFGR